MTGPLPENCAEFMRQEIKQTPLDNRIITHPPDSRTFQYSRSEEDCRGYINDSVPGTFRVAAQSNRAPSDQRGPVNVVVSIRCSQIRGDSRL